MADSDKNILITPNRGATSQPSVVFTGQGNDPITVRVLDGTTGTGLTAGGALSFEGSAGQLFSVVNRLGTGSIFSVNDISGIPSIDVDANGTIEFAPFTGYVAIGLTLPTEKLHVSGNILGSGRISAIGGLSASGGLGVTGGATFNGNIRVNAANTIFTEAIQTATTQLNIDNRSGGRVAIGDQALSGNGTYIFLRDSASTFEISNPFGDIAIGDPLAVDTGNFISYQASTGLLTGNIVSDISGFNNITTGRLNASNGISAAGGGTFSSVVRFLSGLCATTQINVNSSATGASPFTITANSLVDGVGAFRINGSEPDINLNDTDGGFNTITFENAGNARAAIGRDSGDAFYIAVRDPAVSGGAWKGDVIVANSSTGNVSMGYQLSVAGGLCASGVTSNSYVLTSSGLKNVNGITYEFLASDNGKILYTTNDYGPGLTLTIPTGLPIGFNCTIIQTGAGQIRFTGPNGLTLNSYGNQFRTIGRHASATITEYQNNVVNLSGNLIV